MKNIIKNIFSLFNFKGNNKILNELYNEIKILQDLNSRNTEILYRITTFQNILGYIVDVEKLPKAKGITRDLQLFYTRILKSFDEFCNKHNINYWINFGTLLGAVRHKGFVPWDFDLDITMTRTDFNKFKDCFTRSNDLSTNSITHFSLITSFVENKAFPFLIYNCDMRVPEDINEQYLFESFWVDINIFDTCMLNKNYTTAFQTSMKQLNESTTIKNKSPDSFLEECAIIAEQNLANNLYWQDGNVNTYLYPSLGGSLGGNYDKLISKSDIFPLIRLEFEGLYVLAPNNYKKILSTYYHNYYSLPNMPNTLRTFLTHETLEKINVAQKIQFIYDNKIFTPI